jgi:hypothetical protein
METISINIDKRVISNWEKLPLATRQNLASRALNAMLEGSQYPSGPEKIELAIELAEVGVDADTISQLTQLEKEIFAGFLSK